MTEFWAVYPRCGWGRLAPSPSFKTLARNRRNENRDSRACTSKTLNLGVLNVQGCSTSEVKRQEIGDIFRKRKLGLLALSETKMKGQGECDFGGVGGRYIGVGRNEHAKEGVAILVSEEVKEWVVEWREVSSRLMWVKLRIGQKTWVVISAYGPGSERNMVERDQFWDSLEGCIAGMDDDVTVVLLGDLNARVGNRAIDGVVGRHGVNGRDGVNDVNYNGERLIEMCTGQELAIGNTFFKKKKKNKYTWMRVVGGRVVDRALMDYVIVSKKSLGRVMDVHVYRGEAGGISDHLLVQARLKVEGGEGRGRLGGRVREVIRVRELEKTEKAVEFREKIAEEWEGVKGRRRGGVEEEWELFREAVLRCATEVCGTRKVGGTRKKGSEWWDEEVKRKVAEKKKAFSEWLRDKTDQKWENYRNIKNEVKRSVRVSKKRANNRWGRRLTENFSENKKMFWKEVKQQRKEGGKREETVKDRNGQLLTKEEEVNHRWAEHFEELLNFDDRTEARVTPVPFGGGAPRIDRLNRTSVTKVDVEVAVRSMRVGKSAGRDGITAECLKQGGGAIVEWLVRLLNTCFDAGEVPEDWRMAIIVPLYKGKGDKHVCGNYRGISLLSVVGKVYGRVLANRLREGTDRWLSEEQCGFREGRGCVDQLFVVRQACEKYLAKGRESFWAFMDLEKAYDRIDRAALWTVLGFYGVGGKLLAAVKSFYKNSRACVRVGDRESESFEVKVGLRQGCVMSPGLFNIFMDGVVREINARLEGRGLGLIGDDRQPWKLNQILFADDTALVADSEEALQQLVTEFGRVCRRRKLKVNVGKSKVMRCSNEDPVPGLQIQLEGEQLEKVDSFKYLGATVAEGGDVGKEVQHRVIEASRAMGGMNKIFKNREVDMRTKRGLYESIIVPTALYGAETWGLKVEDKKRLDVMEMKCLRSMSGVTIWDRNTNESIRGRTGVKSKLSNRAEQKTLRWFGHMERMNEERLAKRVMNAEVEGANPRGRPKLGWGEGVKNSLKKRNINSLEEGRVIAQDRTEWKKIVKK